MVHTCGAGLRARSRIRTYTGLLPTDFESVSSTSSGMRACRVGGPGCSRMAPTRAGVAHACGMGSVAPAYGRGSDSGLCVFCFSVLMGRSNTLTSPSGLARSFAGVLDVARLLGPLDCLGYPASNVRCRQVGNGDSRNGRVFG